MRASNDDRWPEMELAIAESTTLHRAGASVMHPMPLAAGSPKPNLKEQYR